MNIFTRIKWLLHIKIRTKGETKLKFIIASDSFKGSLSSNQVNNIIESKVKEIFSKKLL